MLKMNSVEQQAEVIVDNSVPTERNLFRENVDHLQRSSQRSIKKIKNVAMKLCDPRGTETTPESSSEITSFSNKR